MQTFFFGRRGFLDWGCSAVGRRVAAGSRGDRHGMYRKMRRRDRDHVLARALDPHFDVAAFQFELGNVLFDYELNEFLQLFLIHRWRWDYVFPRAQEIVKPSNRYQFLASGRQNLAPIVRNHNHVFDANAPDAGDVRSGLNRDHHPRLQYIFLPGGKARRLVDF